MLWKLQGDYLAFTSFVTIYKTATFEEKKICDKLLTRVWKALSDEIQKELSHRLQS